MAEFPHLPFPEVINGVHKPKKIKVDKYVNEVTSDNLNKRETHGKGLLSNVEHLSAYWADNIEKRKALNLPELPNPDVIPVFLQIDTSEFNVESLQSSFGIEIIAEEENGFIIGASKDNFKSLREKIEIFLKNEAGKKFQNKASQLWSINDGTQWKVQELLSDELKAKWNQIQNDEILIIDIGIACYLRISEQPTKGKDDTEEKYQAALARWNQRKLDTEIERDEIAQIRQTEFEKLVLAHKGELISGYVDFEDSFSCRIRISGEGLKDIVLNYQYLFEVIESDALFGVEHGSADIGDFEAELIAPDDSYPSVCVIDSGIQEGHRLLEPAIDKEKSKSFIPGDNNVADLVANGGHGTRVAGAVLYPSFIPRENSYQLPCFIQNARVLSSDATLSENIYPPKLMEEVVQYFEGTRLFNMSINSYSPCKLIHMSQWASSIDKLMFEKDILFILSAGNLHRETGSHIKPGIKDHLNSGKVYPNYLLEEKSSRIANPSQSSFALTVGSVCIEKFDSPDKESFGEKDSPSPFSRTGLGLWGCVKPDVVEYGGDFTIEKNENPNISYETTTSPELVKSTLGGGSGVGNDSVGTSYAAPKVANIAAHLERLYPKQSINLYRALIVQSARLPDRAFVNPTIDHIRHYGYGIPNMERATRNSEKRITLISSGNLSAKQAIVYQVKVPEQMRSAGQDYDVLIEVSLSFMAKPRRTRRKTQSYLSTWLDWESSKLNEKYDQFLNRVLQNMDDPIEDVEDQDSIKWVIRERKDSSKIKDLKRQDSSIQKSWCVMKAYQLPEFLCLAVVGHKGWETDLSDKVPFSIAVSFEALNENINIYEMIRIENEIEIPVEVEIKVN
jgi:hypothetical protein